MVLVFKRPLLLLILAGRKTQTRRISRRQLQQNRIYPILDNYREGAKAYVRIIRKFQQRLADISPSDIKKEGFNTLEEFKAAWISLYGAWQPETTVTVYEFELVNGDCREN
jgi:hypothetical protein